MLMRKRLPEYIVKCLLASGYDKLDVICGMNTTETPRNCIEKVETFVNIRHSNNKEYNPTLCQPFEFPPGHRSRISKFVSELNHLRAKTKEKDIEKSRKRKCKGFSSRVSVACKKSKNQDEHEPIDLTSTDDREPVDVTVVTVSKQVRASLRNWSKKQESGFNNLHEDKHYVFNVIPKENPRFFTVALRCAKCQIIIQIHQKDTCSSSCHSPYPISNFTRHIKLCFSKTAKVHVQSQPSMYDIFSCRKPVSSSFNLDATAMTTVSAQNHGCHKQSNNSSDLVNEAHNEVTLQSSSTQGF